jgi:cellulose biosynthesis protein BcsQ
MITIAIANQKGGVGKTTLSYNLAHILASKRGTGVLAVDNDAQAHLTGSFLADKLEPAANVLNGRQACYILHSGTFAIIIKVQFYNDQERIFKCRIQW